MLYDDQDDEDCDEDDDGRMCDTDIGTCSQQNDSVTENEPEHG